MSDMMPMPNSTETFGDDSFKFWHAALIVGCVGVMAWGVLYLRKNAPTYVEPSYAICQYTDIMRCYHTKEYFQSRYDGCVTMREYPLTICGNFTIERE